TWLQFWGQLDSSAKSRAYHDFLADYWRDQQAHGRFPRPANVQLPRLMDWLAQQQMIPGDLRLQLWLALGFLGVCMLNIVGLLLAKFLRRGGEVSVRRALGARRRDIFAQFGIESAVIGLAGGMLGFALAELGLWSVRQRPDGYAQLAHMDIAMLLVLQVTFTCAIVCNVAFMIAQRIERMQQPSGLAERELTTIESTSLDDDGNPLARHETDLAALRAIPGVKAAAAVDALPFNGNNWSNGLATAPDAPARLAATAFNGTPGELATLGLRLVEGRDFQPGEYLPMGSAHDWD